MWFCNNKTDSYLITIYVTVGHYSWLLFSYCLHYCQLLFIVTVHCYCACTVSCTVHVTVSDTVHITVLGTVHFTIHV